MQTPKNIRVLFIILVYLACSAQAVAQSPQLYTPAQGLTSSNINYLYQDSLGLIWITGEKGLNSFDGLNFRTFRSQKDNAHALRSNTTGKILMDKRGQYWVGSSDGLHLFDSKKNDFAHIPLSVSQKQSDDAVFISEIVEDPGKDHLLVATSGYGIYVLDIESHTIDVEYTRKIKDNTSGDFIKTLLVDSKERLWVSMENNGFFVMSLKSFGEVEPMYERDLMDYPTHAKVNVFLEDHATGNILIGDQNEGLLIYDRKRNIIRRPGNSSNRNFTRVVSLLEQKNGNLLIGTENNGLWEFNRDTEAVSRYHVARYILNMNHSKVHSMIEDTQGNLWLGIYQQGLLKIPQNNKYVQYLPISIAGEYGNAAANTSFVKDGLGNIWVGTDGAGVFYINTKDNTMLNYNKSNSGLEGSSVMSMEKDRQENIWIATYESGMYCYRDKRFFVPQPLKRQEIQRIKCTAYDKKRNHLYIGTHGNGLYRFNLNDNELERIKVAVSGWINTLYIDSSDFVWIGSPTNVFCYNPDENELMPYDLSLIKNTSITAISESEGTIWIANSETIVEYDRRTNTCVFFEADVDVSGIAAIIADTKNGLWATTNNGILYIDLPSKESYLISLYEVSQVREFCSGAAYMASENRLIFGGNNGIILFNPQIEFEHTPQVPPIVFSNLYINENKVDYRPHAGDKNRLDASISNATSIKLDGRHNSFSVDFTVLEYTNPYNINYTYKLEGYDTKWRSVSKNQTAAYEKLPYGNYRLTVKAGYRNTGDQYSTRTIRIKVSYPWYLTIYAKCIYLVLALSLLYVIYRIYYNKYRQKKLLNQAREKERIKEAKLKLFTSISHEIRTPLTLIISPLKKLIEKSEKEDEDTKSVYSLMYRNSMRILMLINQLIDIRKIDNEQFKLHFEQLDLPDEIKNTMLSFNNMAIIKQISFGLENLHSDCRRIWADKLHFDKIFFNLFSNAFKYTPDGGKILTSVQCHENKGEFDAPISEFVEITIFNSGSRISDKDVGNIFERFYQGDNNMGGSGIGLNLTKELVELHHGKIVIRNTAEPEAGVEFKILLPLGNAHLSEEELCDIGTTQVLNPDDTVHKDYLKMFSTNVLSESEVEDKIDKKKINILLVDDDEEFLKYVKSELPEYSVSSCKSGNQAYKQILANMPDVVVTDLMMADGNGYELCNRIKNNPDTDHIPVIVLSSDNDENTRIKSLYNADQYLNKPLNIQLLKGTISRVSSIRENIRNKMHRTEMGYNYNLIKIDSADSKLTQKVINIISENLKEPDFGVEELSREVGMSRVHLNRKLKENFGMSPSTLIKTIRLKQAAYLLIHNKVNISEVAYMVGFSSHSYFSSNFSNYFGMPPKEFVAHYTENADDETIKKLFE